MQKIKDIINHKISATHCGDCGRELMCSEQFYCWPCEGKQEYMEQLYNLETLLRKTVEAKNGCWEEKSMVEHLTSLLQHKECSFCGKELTSKEMQCKPCQEDEEWLDAPLTAEEIESLRRAENEPHYPLEEVWPNGNL